MFLFHLSVLVSVPLLYILFRKVGVSYPLSRLLLLILIFAYLQRHALVKTTPKA